MTLAIDTQPIDPSIAQPQVGWLRLVRIAMRELRGGISGFYVFIACIALGVLVITGVGALSDSLRNGLSREGEALLGGDITFTRVHTGATEDERRLLSSAGDVSEVATLRTMARLPSGDDQTLVALKGVDASYPLVGELLLSDGRILSPKILLPGTVVVDPMVLERLGLALGDPVKIGDASLKIVGTIKKEPDGIANRRSFGPRAMVSMETLQETGLVKPGAVVRWRYALKLPDRSEQDLKAQRSALTKVFDPAGYSIKDRRDPSPNITRTLERLRQFLTLIGLTALLVGGVGVANAVAAFVDKRRKVIGTYKSLGATSGQVFTIFLLQVLAMTAIGIVIGMAGGFVIPLVLQTYYADALPIAAEFHVSLVSVVSAAIYGLLVALLFMLWPLGRTELISPAVLFRDQVSEAKQIPRWPIIALSVGVGLALLAFAVLSSDSKKIAFAFCIGLFAMFVVFIGLGSFVTWAVRKVPRPRMPELALALGNLGAPGGMTRSIVLSLGSGLSLLIAVALTNASLVEELSSRLPENSPDYFLLDINKGEFPQLSSRVTDLVGGAEISNAPMLRGRLMKLGGRPVGEIKAPSEARWVLSGDRGLTYSATVPEGSKIVAGKWWPENYEGPPLVSFEAELAGQLNVNIGDTVTVNVLGRNITATVANLRELNWENLTINFVMVFSPNTLQGAPHNLLATIRLPKAEDMSGEVAVVKALARDHPTVTAIRVKDAIRSFNEIFAKVMTVVQVAGSVTLLAGGLVLAGALATAQRRRVLEAVILKALGATQRRILTAHMFEYVLLALITAVVAILLGTIGAWFALTQVMGLELTFSWLAVLQCLAVSIGLILAFGGYGTWQILKARPVPHLRAV